MLRKEKRENGKKESGKRVIYMNGGTDIEE